jgi:hypothetical protein
MTFAMVCPCASPPISVRRIIMSKVPLSISPLDWFFLGMGLSTRSSMERDHIPLGFLWEETCESTLAAIGQLATFANTFGMGAPPLCMRTSLLDPAGRKESAILNHKWVAVLETVAIVVVEAGRHRVRRSIQMMQGSTQMSQRLCDLRSQFCSFRDGNIYDGLVTGRGFTQPIGITHSVTSRRDRVADKSWPNGKFGVI